jgi:hypothetical protein
VQEDNLEERFDDDLRLLERQLRPHKPPESNLLEITDVCSIVEEQGQAIAEAISQLRDDNDITAWCVGGCGRC